VHGAAIILAAPQSPACQAATHESTDDLHRLTSTSINFNQLQGSKDETSGVSIIDIDLATKCLVQILDNLQKAQLFLAHLSLHPVKTSPQQPSLDRGLSSH
jgi:hypothetical protein